MSVVARLGRWLDRLNVLHLALGVTILLALLNFARASRRAEFFNYGQCQNQCNKAKVKIQRDGCMAQCNAARDIAQEAKRQPKQLAAGSDDSNCNLNGTLYKKVNDHKPVPGGVNKTVRSTYHYYAPQYETSMLACADMIHADKNYGPKLLKYPWFAYCATPFDKQRHCGKCFKLTNKRNNRSIVARAVDMCDEGTQNDLDGCAFRMIDDGQGVADGSMQLHIQEVQCAPDATLTSVGSGSTAGGGGSGGGGKKKTPKPKKKTPKPKKKEPKRRYR